MACSRVNTTHCLIFSLTAKTASLSAAAAAAAANGGGFDWGSKYLCKAYATLLLFQARAVSPSRRQ